jgi:cation diffusion facilitator family transporter
MENDDGHWHHYPSCKMWETGNPNDCHCEERLYRGAIALTLLSAAILGATSYLSHSIALLGELFHMLADSMDSFLSLIVLILVRRWAGEEYRLRRIGAIIAFFLLLASVLIALLWGIERLMNPEKIEPGWMIFGAVMGLALNYYIMRRAGHTPKAEQTVTHAQLHYHAYTDVLMETGVIIGAVAILATGWSNIDSWVMIAIALYLLRFIVPRAYRRIV